MKRLAYKLHIFFLVNYKAAGGSLFASQNLRTLSHALK